MKTKDTIILILIFLTIGIIIGVVGFAIIEEKLMRNYDLYNCIYNNANLNDFTQNSIRIQKIQDECVCFRKNNYTNLSEVNCYDK